MVVRFKLLRSALRAFDLCRRRTPKWGDQSEMVFRDSLVGALTNGQIAEYKDAFAIFDRDGSGSIESWEIKRVLNLQAAGASRRREMSDDDILDMINKANPNIDGNTMLTEADFVAMMAEAEYNEFFREAFAALDEAGNGWVPASSITDLMREFNEESDVMSDINMLKMMQRFDIGEEGHIDYEAFVNLMMSTSGSTAGA